MRISRFAAWVMVGIVLAVVGLGSPAGAEPLDEEEVPPELRPWIPWVLDEVGDAACTSVAGEHRCVWLGRVAVKATPTGATFALAAVTERRTEVPLPGSAKLWPTEVQVGGDAAVVLSRGGKPYATLPRGTHTIEGRVRWRKLPEVLPLPASVARVALEVDGQRREARRSDDGGVWLGGQADAGEDSTETDSLDLAVHRRIQDAVPLRITTQLELRIGGRAREIRLPRPLVKGSTLLSMSSDELSARFEPSGDLVVEGRSGSFAIELVARHGRTEALRLEERPSPWPEQEVWVWSPDVALRSAEVSGGSRVDPAQTRLPAAWRELSAFRLRAPATFTIETKRRGQGEPPPNALSLRRTLILDLDGDGYTVVDALSGEMHRDWRLSFGGSERLGNVSGANDDKLITLDDGRSGVEIRRGRVDMLAVSRGEGAPTHLSAVGWQTDVQGLAYEVRLPPGWELLWASGADHVTPQRLARWGLIDLLLVLALALAVGKLCGWGWAPVAAMAFALAHDAGHAAWWAWVPLVGCVFLLRRSPEGRLRQALAIGRLASASLLVYALVLFAASQLRTIVYPQAVAEQIAERQLEAKETATIMEEDADNKEGGTGTRAKGQEGSMGKVSRRHGLRLQAATPAASAWARDDAAKADSPEDAVPEPEAEQDPQAVIQTGPGVPRWRYTEHDLSWVGTVKPGHEIRLWLLSPLMRALLALLAMALSAVTAVRLLRADTGSRLPPAAVKPTAAAALLLSMLCMSSAARAQEPSRALLDDLKKRLTRAPACAPACVAVTELTATAENDQLTLTAEVHAGARAPYQLPGPARSWVPATVEVDGTPSRALALVDGHLHLRLSPGRHTVKLTGPLRGGELTLTPGTAPHRVTVSVAGWKVEGVDEDGQVASSLRFFRAAEGIAPEDEGPRRAPRQDWVTPPWLEVHRELRAGVRWTMHTEVRRVSETGHPIVIDLPLLEGESVTEGSAKQDGRKATVTLNENAVTASFVSALETRETVTLKAAEDKPWTEVWSLACTEVWRCSHEGLAPVAHVRDGVWNPAFRPWPGETVTLRLARPPAAEGRTLTIHEANLALDVDHRATRAQLTMNVHTSTGGAYPLRIPGGSRIDSLRVDGQAQPTQAKDGALEVTLLPGHRRVYLTWEQPGGASTFYRAPEIVLGDMIVNASVHIDPPSDRWRVFAHGPGMGPDFQLWGYLLLLVAVGLALSRVPDSPLKAWQWAVLAAGLTQLPVAVALLIGGWFFMVVHRKRWSLERRTHNVVQVIVALWTVASAIGIAAAIYVGLAERPDMMIAREGFAPLSWYVDRTAGTMPRPWVVSTSVWVWRLAMAAWSAWVAVFLYRWAPTVWASLSAGGLWRRAPRKAPEPAAAEAPDTSRSEDE